MHVCMYDLFIFQVNDTQFPSMVIALWGKCLAKFRQVFKLCFLSCFIELASSHAATQSGKLRVLSPDRMFSLHYSLPPASKQLPICTDGPTPSRRRSAVCSVFFAMVCLFQPSTPRFCTWNCPGDLFQITLFYFYSLSSLCISPFQKLRF